MSFLIYIVRSNLSEITGGEIRKYFRAKKNFTLKQDGAVLRIEYKNPHTTARCLFSFSSKGLEETSSNAYETYRAAQLSFTLEYLCPSFYAHEAIAQLERFTNDLLLQILNPQSKKNYENPDMFVRSEILNDWKRGNLEAISEKSRNGGHVPFLDPKLTVSLKNYLGSRHRLKKKFKEDEEEIHVPELKVLYDQDSKKTMTTINLSWCEASVLPISKSVLVERIRKKGLLGLKKVEERGIASYRDVVKALKPFITPLALQRPDYTILVFNPDDEKAAMKAFLDIPLTPPPKQMKKLDVNGFVDIWPKAGN
jgi:hypothetical protein